MDILVAITMIVMGILAAPGLILGKKADVVAKIAPYQGIIGVVGFLWGIFLLIRVISIISIIKYVPIFWLTALAVAIMMILLGFLLGYALISKVKTTAAGEAAKAKLASLSGTLGIIGVALGVWMLLVRLFFRF
jgi:hypothetical protein